MTSRFSALSFIIVTVANLLGCAFLASMTFSIEMSSFSASSGEVKQGIIHIQLLAWVWTTGTMIAYSIYGLQEELLATAACFWAIVLGTVAGFAFPRLAANGSRNEPSEPEQW